MRRIQVWPLVAYLAGLLALFVGERLFSAEMMTRCALDGAGGLAMLAALLLRLRDRAAMSGDHKRVLGSVVLLMAGGIVAVALHWLAATPVVEALGLVDEGAERYSVVITVVWLIALLATVCPLMFVEIVLLAGAASPVLETARVHKAAEAGLVLALAASLLFAVNYLAAEHNSRHDLSYAKTTEPSSATLLLVESFSEPVRFVLFFPAANEVREEVIPYFKELAATNELVTLEVLDHDAEPVLAKELKARKNGTIVLARGEKSESYSLGTDIDKAKKKLKKLDKEVHKRLIKVAKPQLVSYLTTGHGERDWTKNEEDKRPPIKKLKTWLQFSNYKVERLGLAEGLASEVPEDASVVMVFGPEGEFLDEEVAALQAYLDAGGDMLVVLDAVEEATLEPLLAPMGITFHGDVLANDEVHIPKFHQLTDRVLLISDSFSSHATVKTMQKNSSKFPVVMPGIGYLETSKDIYGNAPEVIFKSLPKTWADLDGNLKFDKDTETRKVYTVGAAYERVISESEEEGQLTSRVVVLSGADMLSDMAIENDGNNNLLSNCLRWLVGEEELAGELTTEEDVRIQHTRKEDTWWFYSTIFGVPCCVLGAGILITNRRRRTRR